MAEPQAGPESQGGLVKKTAKALAALVALGLCERWAPTLTNLLAIVVLLMFAAYAWRTVAHIPPRQLAELLVVAAAALLGGFLWQFGIGRLTGVFLLITVPLWRRARPDPRDEEDAAHGSREGP